MKLFQSVIVIFIVCFRILAMWFYNDLMLTGTKYESCRVSVKKDTMIGIWLCIVTFGVFWGHSFCILILYLWNGLSGIGNMRSVFWRKSSTVHTLCHLCPKSHLMWLIIIIYYVYYHYNRSPRSWPYDEDWLTPSHTLRDRSPLVLQPTGTPYCHNIIPLGVFFLHSMD